LGNISITNIALVAVLIKLMLTPQLATADLLAFVASMVGYNVKRFVVNPNTAVSEDTEELRKAVESMQTKIVGLQMQGQTRK
jgi:hypothetical protein